MPPATLPLVSLLVAAVAFALSCLLFPPSTVPWSMGLEFAAMSSDPFAVQGPFPYRLFGPVVAWCLGLRGDAYGWFANGTVVLFLAVVNGFAWSRTGSWRGAAVLTAVVAGTGAIELYKGHVGYAEPLVFTFLLVGAMLVRRPVLFWVAMFLGLTNHEEIVFFWPWLLWTKARTGGGLGRADAVGGVVAVAAYLALRWTILARASQGVLSAQVYVHLPTTATLAVWALAALSSVLWFGTLPALLAWHARERGWRDAGVPILLVLGAIGLLCTMATDMPRFVMFLVLPVVLAGVELLRRQRGTLWLAALGATTAAANVLQRPVSWQIVDALLKRMPDPFPAIVVDLWPLFAAYGAALSGMILAGAWSARR